MPFASVTLTQKNFETVEAGVPVMTPVVEFRVNPAGRLPSVTAKLYGAAPPLATITPEYGAPTTPVGNVVVRLKDQLGAALAAAANKSEMITNSVTTVCFLACLNTGTRPSFFRLPEPARCSAIV